MRSASANESGRHRSAGVSRLRQRARGDHGTTLIELMVGMTLMAVFLAMFTGAILMMTTAVSKTQAVNLTSSQLNVAFLNLDSIVRNAATITPPGVGKSGNWYVELRTTAGGTEICTQLRVDSTSQQLQSRTWPVDGGVAANPTRWVPMASGITNGSALEGPNSQPFWLVPPLGSAAFQQLTVTLAAPAGSGSVMTTSTSSFTVSALNSTVPAPTTPVCQQQGRP